MISNTKICLFVAIFSTCIVLDILLPVIYPASSIFHDFDVFASSHANYIFSVAIFLVFSLVLALVLDFGCCKIKENMTDAPKIGELLISQGFITREQLEEALTEQQLRTGEVLVRAGRITVPQRDFALQVQKSKMWMIGEVLIELGYTDEQDILWALNRINRKIGQILRDRQLITDYDLRCALSLKTCKFDSEGRIV